MDILGIVKNVNVLGALIVLFGIVGHIQSKWVVIKLYPIQRILICLLGAIVLGLGFITPTLSKDSKPNIKSCLLKDGDTYQWQFAGQNWLGEIKFNETDKGQIEATLEVIKRFIIGQPTEGEKIKIGDLPSVIKTEDGGDGKVYYYDDHIEIRDLLVTRSLFEPIPIGDGFQLDGIKTKKKVRQNISGSNLRLVPAFAGPITYKNIETGLVGKGNIILVKFMPGVR